ncbi:MAG TPA: hypothetical protein PKD24_02710 [Pyrinomonadaceae bacterium]|nr:hypothetical protein [Pyrinomonadaceae bacterium]
MNYRFVLNAGFLWFALGFISLASLQSSAQRQPKAAMDVDYCRMVRSPESFDGKIVRFTSLMSYSTVVRVDGDSFLIYGTDCNGGDYFSAVDLLAEFKWSEQAKELLRGVQEGGTYTLAITAIGKFENQIIPSFGHLGWAINQVTLFEIESIEDITSKPEATRPSYRTETNRTEFGRRLRDINAGILFLFLDGPKDPAILESIAEDFKVIDRDNVSYSIANYSELIRKGLFDNKDQIAGKAVTDPRVVLRNGLYQATGFLKAEDVEGSERRLKYQTLFRRIGDLIFVVETRFSDP